MRVNQLFHSVKGAFNFEDFDFKEVKAYL